MLSLERHFSTKLGKYEEAIVEYDKALKVNPKYVDAYNNKGLSLHNLGRYEEAILEYDKALKINPKYVMLMPAKVFLYIILDDMKK